MGYTIDPSYKNYKLFRLKLAAEQVKSAKILPSSFMNLIAPDPGLMQEKPEPHVYRCRKCRRIVASKSNLITHKPKDQELNSFDSPLPKRKEKLESSQKFLNMQCQEAGSSDDILEITDQVMATSLNDKPCDPPVCTKTFFVEPMTWMKDVAHGVEGKLYCPSCKSKIGSYNWTMASRCPCGAQVSPSFYLVPSKIEYSNIVQNMQQVTVWSRKLLTDENNKPKASHDDNKAHNQRKKSLTLFWTIQIPLWTILNFPHDKNLFQSQRYLTLNFFFSTLTAFDVFKFWFTKDLKLFNFHVLPKFHESKKKTNELQYYWE